MPIKKKKAPISKVPTKNGRKTQVKPGRKAQARSPISGQVPSLRHTPPALVDAADRLGIAHRRLMTLPALTRAEARVAVATLLRLLDETGRIIADYYQVAPVEIVTPAAPVAVVVTPVAAPVAVVMAAPIAPSPVTALPAAAGRPQAVRRPPSVSVPALASTVAPMAVAHVDPPKDLAAAPTSITVATTTPPTPVPAPAPVPAPVPVPVSAPATRGDVDLFGGDIDPTPAGAPATAAPALPAHQAPHALWMIDHLESVQSLLVAESGINCGPNLFANQVRAAIDNGNLVPGSRIILAQYQDDGSALVIGHVGWKGTITRPHSQGKKGVEVFVYVERDFTAAAPRDHAARVDSEILASCMPKTGGAMIAIGPHLRVASSMAPEQGREWARKRSALWAAFVRASGMEHAG